jgi:hypothetical protein
MLSYLVAYGLLIHLLFWGAGLAMVAMPKPWRKFWPLLAPASGLFLQSVVVWLGAYLGFKGTNAYAWPSEIVPLVLLAIGLRIKSQSFLKDILRVSAVFVVMAGALFCAVRPMTKAAPGLTTISLGSCDAADYAGGARALMEFARSDRTGFLGLSEVVRVMSVDNFSDYFLKLNHFTPSALIAFNGTILNCAPYELISLFTAVSMVLVLPIVFWCARSLLKLGALPSVLIAALYGFSPPVLYAVYHVAIGQLFAALAIAWVTWAGVNLWKYKQHVNSLNTYLALLIIAYGIILGSYNFIIIVTLVPCAGFVGLDVFLSGKWRPLIKWFWLMLLPLIVAGILFWDRVIGLIERFILFRTFDEGWKIPAFTPEGWLGLVHGPSLSAYDTTYRLVLAVLVLLLLIFGIFGQLMRSKQQVLLTIGFIFPIVIGYSYLIVRGIELGTNASYDGYKLFSVFYPVVLPALLCWLPRRKFHFGFWPATTCILFIALFIGNIAAASGFWNATRVAPLVVGRDLIGVKVLESYPEIKSVNMRIPDMWSRLWANALLLKVPQYFLTHTYEARLNTELKGDWDLVGGIFQIELPNKGSIRFNEHYSAVNVRDSHWLRIEPKTGWYDTERQPRSVDTWQWSMMHSSVQLFNPHPTSQHVILKVQAESLVDQRLGVYFSGTKVADLNITTTRSKCESDAFFIPSGTTQLELIAENTPPRASATDSRLLAFRVYGFVIQVLP